MTKLFVASLTMVDRRKNVFDMWICADGCVEITITEFNKAGKATTIAHVTISAEQAQAAGNWLSKPLAEHDKTNDIERELRQGKEQG